MPDNPRPLSAILSRILLGTCSTVILMCEALPCWTALAAASARRNSIWRVSSNGTAASRGVTESSTLQPHRRSILSISRFISSCR